ncbi:hypothetical protein CRENBAI_015949, partial [Crenichthys baileyi]
MLSAGPFEGGGGEPTDGANRSHDAIPLPLLPHTVLLPQSLFYTFFFLMEAIRRKQ